MKTITVTLAALVIFCMTTMSDAADLTPQEIAGTYRLTRHNGAAFTADRPAELRLGPGLAMAGRVCNTFRGQYTLENDVLRMEDFMTTRMACPGDVGVVENAFLSALRSGFGVMAYGDTLELRRDDQIFIFTRSAAASEDKTPEETEAPSAVPATPTTPAAPVTPAEPVSSVVQDRDLVGKTFVLRRVDGEDFSSEMGRQPTIAFGSDMRISGRACNHFSGPGEIVDGVLTITNAASTMMMCVDQALSSFERDFHQMVRDGARLALDGDILTLSGNGRVFEYQVE